MFLISMGNVELLHGDCLELMKDIEKGSIDLILCDLPYGTTSCKWDILIPFDKLWEQYERIIKENGAIVLTASQPFTTKLIMSKINLFKYELIWEKSRNSNPSLAKSRPLPHHENILIFGKKIKYNPQKTVGDKYLTRKGAGGRFAGNKVNKKDLPIRRVDGRFPKTILKIKSEYPNSIIHPTQKPVALMEYMIKTYSNESDLILDNCMGSGTTGVACKNINRRFIGIELDEEYFKIAKQRIEDSPKP